MDFDDNFKPMHKFGDEIKFDNLHKEYMEILNWIEDIKYPTKQTKNESSSKNANINVKIHLKESGLDIPVNIIEDYSTTSNVKSDLSYYNIKSEINNCN